MIIGMDGSLALNKPTGIGRYIVNLISSLSELDDQNSYRLFYHHSRPLRKAAFYKPAKGDFQTRRVRIPGRILNWCCLRLGFPKIEDFLGEVDVFHFTVYSPWRTRKAKTVLTVHDLLAFKHPEFWPEHRGSFFRECHLKAVPMADTICVDSEDAKRDLLDIFGVPESKTRVIHLGVEERFRRTVRASPDRLRRELNIDFPYILNVGIIEPRKNLAGVVEAFSLLKETKRVPHHLVVVGSKGHFHQVVFSRIEKSNHREQIHILGYVPDEELPNLYAGADVFVLPSFYEGFGLPVLEAMACGTPVVTSNDSSLSEIGSGAAHLVDPRNIEEIAWAMEKIIFDKEYGRELSEKGRKRAKEFDWRKTALQTLRVYEDLGS
jgi:glycosyltransferase involved in cell wall biosynthesis